MIFKYGVQLTRDLSFEYGNGGVCLWGGNWKGWRGSVSVPCSWFQGKFDSFSSVTLKVSFSTPGFYQHTLQAASSRKKKREERKKTQSSVNESIWMETKMTYHLCAGTDWCCITHSCNKQREANHIVHSMSFMNTHWISLLGSLQIPCNRWFRFPLQQETYLNKPCRVSLPTWCVIRMCFHMLGSLGNIQLSSKSTHPVW